MEDRLPVFELLKDLQKPFSSLVLVGANRGKEITAFENYGIDWAIMVEPQAEPFGKLKRRVAGIPRYIPVKALCSSVEGVEYDFYVADNKGQSSSLLKPTRHRIEYPGIDFPSQMKLTSTTIDMVVTRVVQRRPGLSFEVFDTLVIDVQGAELKVLMGGTRLLQHVKYVFTEVNYDLYEGGATLDDLQSFLRPFGFELTSLTPNRYGWADGLFIKSPRENGRRAGERDGRSA
jgi:FkbM family methyltransferase